MIRKLIKRFFGTSSGVVPVVRLSGIIASGNVRRGLSLSGISPLLDKAFDIKNAKAVALVINSPGGSPVQSSLIYERIRHLSSKKNIPVLAFVEDVAASGGYWLACAGDEIFVNSASVLGSIGVVSSGFGFDQAIEKLGIKRRVYTAGTRKGMLDPFLPESEADIEHLRALQKDIHDQFITMVKMRRGSRLSDNDDLFSGAFWTGNQSISLGLADKTGELRQVLEARFGPKIEIKYIPQKRSLFGFASTNEGISLTDDLVASSIDTALSRLEEHQIRSRFGL